MNGLSSGFRSRVTMIPVAAVAFLLAGACSAAAPAPGWTRLTDLPTPQAFPSQTPQRIGDRILLLAGADYRVTTLLIYDIASDSWSSKPTALLTSRHHYATAALDGKFYVAGGCLGESDAIPHRRTNAFESYDPATGLWTPLPPMLSERQAFQLVAFEDELYAIGGVDHEAVPITTIEIYNPAVDTWRSVPAPWGQSLGWVSAVVHGDRILAFGRMKDRSVFLEYHPRTNTFFEKPVGPAADKRNYGVALAGDLLLLVGAGGKEPGGTVLGFDLVKNEWRTLPDLPQARGHAGVTAIGNRVLCLGGWGPTWDWAHPNSTVFAFQFPPSTGTAK